MLREYLILELQQRRSHSYQDSTYTRWKDQLDFYNFFLQPKIYMRELYSASSFCWDSFSHVFNFDLKGSILTCLLYFSIAWVSFLSRVRRYLYLDSNSSGGFSYISSFSLWPLALLFLLYFPRFGKLKFVRRSIAWLFVHERINNIGSVRRSSCVLLGLVD